MMSFLQNVIFLFEPRCSGKLPGPLRNVRTGVLEFFAHSTEISGNKVALGKDSEGNDNCIIVINYTKLEDIKVACLEINTLDEEICKQLILIKNKTKDYNNANYSIAINDKKVDILKYNDENEDNVIDVIEEHDENEENEENNI